MNKTPSVIAFIGAGRIANAHAYALANLVFYYTEKAPVIIKKYMVSNSKQSATKLQKLYGFETVLSNEELFERNDFDTIFILTPNSSHFEYLIKSIEHLTIKNIYLEKPVCCSEKELMVIKNIVKKSNKNIQIGFQFLQMAGLRKAWNIWKDGHMGNPIHFCARYLHSGYLERDYRDMRKNRLIATPTGGALADLAPHILSLLILFIGDGLKIDTVLHNEKFADVPLSSDLFSQITLHNPCNRAIGAATVSRISYATGDQLELEIFAEQGAIKFSSLKPDSLYYSDKTTNANWTQIECGNDFDPYSKFPNAHVPAGWLRSLVHAHYLFLTNNQKECLSTIKLGLKTQHLIFDCANKIINKDN